MYIPIYPHGVVLSMCVDVLMWKCCERKHKLLQHTQAHMHTRLVAATELADCWIRAGSSPFCHRHIPQAEALAS